MHAKLALIELAKFHALGIVCQQQRPEFFDLAKGPIEVSMVTDSRVFDDMHDKFVKMLCANPKISQYEERIKKAFSTGSGNTILDKKSKNIWKTFTHGDFWVSNILFRHEPNGKPVDVKFVDFQVANYDAGLKDVSHFLFGSCNTEVVTHSFDELLIIYYETFLSILVRFGMDLSPYSRVSFDEQFKEEARNMFTYIMISMKFTTTDAGQDFEMKNIINDVVLGKCSEDYIERVNVLVQQYMKRVWV